MMHTSRLLLPALLPVLAIGGWTAGCASKDPGAGESSTTAGESTTTTASTSDGSTSVDTTVSTSTDPSTEPSTTASDVTGEATTTGGDVELRGACALADRVGSFQVAMEADYTAFSGSVADGVVPVTILEQVGDDGTCVLLRRNNPFCDPMCTPGQTCDFDGTCVPYPANHDVGVVTVTGLVQPVMVEPLAPTFSYFDTSLMHPAFEPGAAIELSAEGGDYEAFVMHGIGVAMVVPSAKEITLNAARAVPIEWTPSGSDATLRLVMKVDQHGLTPVQLICESDDTGSMVISAEIIAQFVASGVTGFPSADYYLQTADSVDLAPGCVDFVVRSHVQTPLTVEGHTPCNGPGDCPDGQVCNVPIQTCE